MKKINNASQNISKTNQENIDPNNIGNSNQQKETQLSLFLQNSRFFSSEKKNNSNFKSNQKPNISPPPKKNSPFNIPQFKNNNILNSFPPPPFDIIAAEQGGVYTKELEVNLRIFPHIFSNAPEQKLIQEISNTVVAVGDMHGNFLKLFWELLYFGIFKIVNGDPKEIYNQFVEIADVLSKLNSIPLNKDSINYVNYLIKGLENLIENNIGVETNLEIILNLLGDVFADRGPCDYPTMMILHKLFESIKNSNAKPLSIIFSNHDSAFVGYIYNIIHENNQDKILQSIFPQQMNSLLSMNFLMCSGIIKKENILDFFCDDYAQMTKLIDYVESGENCIIYSHAPVTLCQIVELAKNMGISIEEKGLAKIADEMNEKFREALQNIRNTAIVYFAVYPWMKVIVGGDPSNITSPFYAMLWQRHPCPGFPQNAFQDISKYLKEHSEEEQKLKRMFFDKKNYVNIHGHTGQTPTTRNTYKIPKSSIIKSDFYTKNFLKKKPDITNGIEEPCDKHKFINLDNNLGKSIDNFANEKGNFTYSVFSGIPQLQHLLDNLRKKYPFLELDNLPSCDGDKTIKKNKEIEKIINDDDKKEILIEELSNILKTGKNKTRESLFKRLKAKYNKANSKENNSTKISKEEVTQLRQLWLVKLLKDILISHFQLNKKQNNLFKNIYTSKETTEKPLKNLLQLSLFLPSKMENFSENNIQEIAATLWSLNKEQREKILNFCVNNLELEKLELEEELEEKENKGNKLEQENALFPETKPQPWQIIFWQLANYCFSLNVMDDTNIDNLQQELLKTGDDLNNARNNPYNLSQADILNLNLRLKFLEKQIEKQEELKKQIIKMNY